MTTPAQDRAINAFAIEHEWKAFLRAVDPVELFTPEQIAETRDAFFAGSKAMFRTISDTMDADADAITVERVFTGLDAELTDFISAYLLRKGIGQ